MKALLIVSALVLASFATQAQAEPIPEMTQIRMSAEKQVDLATAKMNAVEKLVERSFVALGKEDETMRVDIAIDSLREVQKAFLIQAESQCSLDTALLGEGGSALSMDILQCEKERIDARTKELRGYLTK